MRHARLIGWLLIICGVLWAIPSLVTYAEALQDDRGEFVSFVVSFSPAIGLCALGAWFLKRPVAR
jgi:hypothetical protein